MKYDYLHVDCIFFHNVHHGQVRIVSFWICFDKWECDICRFWWNNPLRNPLHQSISQENDLSNQLSIVRCNHNVCMFACIYIYILNWKRNTISMLYSFDALHCHLLLSRIWLKERLVNTIAIFIKCSMLSIVLAFGEVITQPEKITRTLVVGVGYSVNEYRVKSIKYIYQI